MKAKPKNNPENEKEQDLPGYPIYPEDEDIYAQTKEEADLDPENPTHKKAPNADPEAWNEKNFKDDVTGGDLDIPGNEDDEDEENAGSEDEENNFYSLGDEPKE